MSYIVLWKVTLSFPSHHFHGFFFFYSPISWQSKTQSLPSVAFIPKIAKLGNQKAELNTVQCVYQGRTSCCVQSSWLGNLSISLFLMFALNEPLHFEGNTEFSIDAFTYQLFCLRQSSFFTNGSVQTAATGFILTLKKAL